MRVHGTKLGAISTGRGLGDQLYDLAGQVPPLDLNFAGTKTLDPRVTHTRASSGTFVGSDGVLRTAVTNYIRNNTGVGAVAGTPGTLPTHSSYFANGGLTTSVIGTGTQDGINYVDIRLNGTTATTFLVYAFDNVAASASAGQAWTESFWVSIVGGSTANISTISVNLRQSGGSSTVFDTPFTPSASLTRVSGTATLGTGATGVTAALAMSFSAGVAIDITLRIGLPQLELSSTPGEAILTTGVINSAPRFDHNPTTGESLGLLVEEARTNSIRNNTMVGAVAGTPGTLPTNWAIGGAAGLTSTVVGVGTLNGISYIDLQLVGTSSGTFTTILFEPATQVAATNAQAWAISSYVSIVAGSVAGSSVSLTLNQINSGGSLLAQLVGADIASSLNSSLARFSFASTTNQATIAFVRPLLGLNYSSGVAIDFTLRIGLPQLEQGAFATSPILTSSATATRAADVASITGNSFGTSRTNLLVRSEDFDNASWSKVNTTVAANSITDPNGTITADTITDSNDASAAIHSVTSQNQSFTSGLSYTVSVYARAGTQPGVAFVLPAAAFTSNLTAAFNISTGTIVSLDSGMAGSITAVGGGWYRCTATATATTTASSSTAVQIRIATASTSFYQGNGTGTIRLWGAQLEVGSAATPYIQSPSVFTSRASSATYVGGDGLIKTATTNLLLRSEEFNDASWAKSNITISANSVSAPNGTVTADTLTDSSDGAAVAHSVITPTQSFTSGLAYTISVYAQAGSLAGVAFIFPSAAFTSNLNARFNISTGTIQNLDSGLTGSITAVGGNWYRCSATATATATASNTVQIRTATASSSFYQGNGTGTIYLWGAQLEQSSTVGEYIPTTSSINSAARYDHDPVSLIGKGLLLEGASTNLFLNSEDFSNPTWTAGSVTVTANAATAPTGATTADSLLETSANTEHLIYNTSPVTFTTATQSVYVKPNGRTNVALRFYSAPDDWVARVFSLTGNGSVTQSSAGSSSGFSAVSSSIVNAGNGWYRISMTATQTSRSVYVASPDLCTSSTPTLATVNGSEVYAGDITKGVYVWGAQLETTSTVSSYIPTAASTVTRAADVSTSTATSVFESSWYRQDEGTLYGDAQTPFAVTGFPVIADGRVSSTDIVQIGFVTESLSVGYVKAANADQAVMYNTGLSGVRRRSVACGMAANNFAILTNGGSLVTDSSGSMPTNIASIFIGSTNGSSASLNGTIRRLTYWPTRLGNEVLQRITQP